MRYGTEAIRAVALVGHAGCGKTSLTEALLQEAGVIGARGSLERGTTVCDFDPLARKYQHSLNSTLVHLPHRDTRIHLIDTPGTAEFIGPAIAALAAVETAAVVVNAQTGIDTLTERMMAWAAQRQLCRLIVVNKIDADSLDLAMLVEQLRQTFGAECLPVNLPSPDRASVVDCFFNDAGDSAFSSVAAAHDALIDQVVEVDPDVMARYLEQGDVAPQQLHAPFEKALREGHLVPICFVSARTGAGVAALLDIMAALLPNPAEGNPPVFLRDTDQGTETLQATPDPEQHVLAHVFKVVSDPYAGKLGIFRVHQGTVRRDGLLYVGDGRRPFKVNHLFLLQGKEHIDVSEAGPGELCAVAKVDEIAFDAVLHDAAEDAHIHLRPCAFPAPIYGLAIEPVRHGDAQRLWEVLQKLAAEDPCLRVEHHAGTNETVVMGMGELHLRCLLERMADMYKLEVRTHPPKIAYRETVTARAEGHHRHKKQTGGAGQFGEVFLRIEPIERGDGFEFVDEVKGGAIPGQFMPAVEKGIRQVLESGPLAGFPMQDVRVVVYDGKSHPVDSKEVAFVTAGRKAFIDAVMKARPMVLEPIVNIEIASPEAQMGDVIGDLSARHGQVNGTRASTNGHITITGQVPMSELDNYQSRLHSLTGGTGSYTLALSHYAPVASAVQQRLAAAHRPSGDDD